MNKVGCYSFLAEPFHCDFSGRLFMGHLGNHMLNAADFHSTDRGFGMKYLMTIQRSWVLSRLAIEMDEMPQQYTKFNVETWVESAMRYFTSRNFSVIGNDGHTYGYGRSIWAMIDTETRQPTDIFSIDNGGINNWIVADKPCPIDKGGRVKMSDQAQLLRTIDTFRLFEKVNILTGGGPAGTTTTITQFLYNYGIKNLKFGFGSAGAIVMTLLVLILSSFYIRRAIH